MKKRFLSLLCVLALCLGLLPVTALAAAEGAPNSLYVGNQQVISSSDITYWTTDESTGGLTKYEGNNDNWNVKYDPSTATLTLSGATIKGGSDVVSIPYGSGIYAQGSSNQPVTLTIELIGENTVTGTFGIYVNATPPTTPGTDASLVIKKSGDNGSLTVTGTGNSGLHIISGTGNASLTIENASVDAKTTQTYSSYAGVCVQSGASATGSPQLSLAVNGGSLTVSGSTSGDGIQFYVGNSSASATTSLSVTDHAIVDARNGGISALRSSETLPTPTPTGGNSSGIVFDGTEGTVYGAVTLQEDLEIGEGETLTIGQDASLTTDGKLTVNGGTLNGTPNGDVTYKVTGVSLNKDSLTLDVGSSETLNATVAPNNATNQKVTWTSNEERVATVDESGKVEAVAPGTATITATAADGSKTDTCTVTVTQPVTGVNLNKTTLSLYTGETATLTATVTPENATNKAVTWSSSNTEVATVDNNGKVTALKPGTATITATADGVAATCTVTVSREPVIPETNGITVTQPANGSVKVNPSNGSAGTLITVTATPDEGYELAYITVDGEKISGSTFRMPDKAVTVSAVFVPVTFPFVDVKTGDWFYDYVAYVYSNGLMDGTSATTFEPNANMTRAMVWAILARIDGEEITGSSWATDARAWAMAEGVSDGTDPNGLVTREQFTTMLYRYAVAKGYDVSIGESTNILSYADFGQISEYAIPAMQWACGSGVITGVTDSTLEPQGTATRAQCAAMLMRFVEL